jgi:hypothetical protein
MTENDMSGSPKPRLWIKNLHNWIGLGSSVFLLVLLVTGVLLNHPTKFIKGASEERLALAADPANPSRLYRGTVSSLERSEDGGRSWEEVPMLFPAQEAVDIVFRPGRPETIYALQRWHGPLRSEDGGTVWEPVDLPFDPQGAGVELIGMAVEADGTVYLETSAGMLKRGAGAADWEEIDFDPKTRNWLRIVKTLHNGHFFGEWFVKVYDLAAAALLGLIVTGFVLWRVKSS